MENINSLQKVLEFYKYTNKLKTKITDKENGLSRADTLFGSLILATACDYEFHDGVDLSKIYRMLFFSSLQAANNHHYDLESLQDGAKFKAELEEFRNRKSRSSHIAHKLKKLEHVLSSLITQKQGIVSEEELIREGATILSSVLKKDYNSCTEIFRFFYLNHKLTQKDRTGWDKNHWNVKSPRLERVSEHIVSTLGLALAFSSEFKQKIDFNKVFKMLVLHEIGETLMPDFTPFDGITPEQKREMEHKAMSDALGNLMSREEMLALLFEFDEHKTPEAKFAYFIDKIEADLQAKVYQEKGLHHDLDDQEGNVVYKSPRIIKMIEDGAQDAFEVFFEWDRAIYEGDTQFPEFFDLLCLAKDNNILKDMSVLKKKIKVSPEEFEKLVSTLGPVLKIMHEIPEVDAIYVNNYASRDYPKGKLNFTAVTNGHSGYLLEIITQLKYICHKDHPSIGFDFDTIHESNYSMVPMNPSEVKRTEELAESTIVFDKKNKISEIKKQFKKFGHFFKFYFMRYEPPVDEVLAEPFKK